ncbi:MAG: GNAT family N-acetyltransferase [Oscillospiraceae bacterium]|jgi:N-acetylglutamate synthase-like GNAT family acetyltransferase|nr:GNAT family N-acetyltransferase [Oscillospiraceae bacterium]
MSFEIISVRDNPKYLDAAIGFFASKWSIPRAMYDDCIRSSVATESKLPRWYLLRKVETGEIVGGFGLITNDFNSRQDLWPWIAAVHIEEAERGRALGGFMLEHAVKEAKSLGFGKVYLATDQVGYYEKYGFSHIGSVYGLDGESRLYEKKTRETPLTASEILAELYSGGQGHIQVGGEGVVKKLLADDLAGDRHQRFIIELPSGQTLLVTHNIDVAPRLDTLKVGDTVEFFGNYIWNEHGGLIHWTHADPKREHEAGFLKLGERKYQ